jgi:hypothetical protein
LSSRKAPAQKPVRDIVFYGIIILVRGPVTVSATQLIIEIDSTVFPQGIESIAHAQKTGPAVKGKDRRFPLILTV